MVANALMKNIFKAVGFIVLALILAYVLYNLFGSVFFSLFSDDRGSSWWGSDDLDNFIIGFPLAYLFFVTLSLTASFKNNKKYILILLLVVTGLIPLLYLDFSRIYFFILFPIAGWIIGWGISKLIPKKAV